MTDKAVEENRSPKRAAKSSVKRDGQKGVGKGENRFSKEQLLSAERFRDRKDIVDALLDEKETYTVKTVEEKIEDYRKGKVK